MKSLFSLSILAALFVSTSAHALPQPAAVWACLQSSDPAMESDGDAPAGSNPVLCHLESYTVKDNQTSLHIDSQFSCLMDNGQRKNLSGTADCAVR